MKNSIFLLLFTILFFSCKKQADVNTDVLVAASANNCKNPEFIVVDTIKMKKDNLTLDKNYVCNAENAGTSCSNGQKIVNLNQISDKPKWLKDNCKYICFEESCKYIIASHSLTVDEEISATLNQFKIGEIKIVNDVILNTIYKDTVPEDDYNKWVSFDIVNKQVVTSLVDYKTDLVCYSVPFLKCCFKNVNPADLLKFYEISDPKISFFTIGNNTQLLLDYHIKPQLVSENFNK